MFVRVASRLAGTSLVLTLALPLALPLAGCKKPGAASDPGPEVDEREEKLIQDIAAHRFWKVKVSPDDVRGWVTTIEGLRNDRVFVVAEMGRPKIVENDQTFQAMDQTLGQGRVVFVNMRKYGSAPGRRRILEDLAREVRQADFRTIEGWLNPDAPEKKPAPGDS